MSSPVTSRSRFAHSHRDGGPGAWSGAATVVRAASLYWPGVTSANENAPPALVRATRRASNPGAFNDGSVAIRLTCVPGGTVPPGRESVPSMCTVETYCTVKSTPVRSSPARTVTGVACATDVVPGKKTGDMPIVRCGTSAMATDGPSRIARAAFSTSTSLVRCRSRPGAPKPWPPTALT